LAQVDYRGTLDVDWVPGSDANAVREALADLIRSDGNRAVHNLSQTWLPKRYWVRLVELEGWSERKARQLNSRDLNTVLTWLKQARFAFEGKSTHKDEFVTAGGVNLREVDFRRMQSKLHEGLYFAGEVLDVDGITGGFNFQAAWTTAYLASLDVRSRWEA
jgi:predicted Rossmann fold flavoprotein